MGNTSSKINSTTRAMNKALTNIAISNSTKCNADSINNQELNISNINADGCQLIISDLTQNISVNQNIKCISASVNNTDLQNQFKTELQEQLKAELEVDALAKLIPGDTKNEINTITEVSNEISTNVDISQLLECVSTNINNQLINLKQIDAKCYSWQTPKERRLTIKNIKQQILASQIQECMQQNETITKAANKFDTLIKKKVEASTKVALGAGSLASMMIFVIIFIMLFL